MKTMHRVLGCLAAVIIHGAAAGAGPTDRVDVSKVAPARDTFTADVTVQHIPSTMRFALPESIYTDPVQGSFSYPAYLLHVEQCSSDFSHCTVIQLYEDCNLTDCTSGNARVLTPEVGLQCEVYMYDNVTGDYGDWPCRFSINAARDTFHIAGSTIPVFNDDEVFASAQYVAGAVVPVQIGGESYACFPRRENIVYALTPNDAGTVFDGADPAGNVESQECSASGGMTPKADMEAATDILAVHVELSPQAPSPVALDQHGFTGTWFNPNTTGEGFILEDYPSIGLLSAGWFTYDTQAGGPESQRWYVLSGAVSADATQVEFGILAGYGGNFDAQPVVPLGEVGRATLRLDSCTRGRFEYLFYDGRHGVIDLTRFTQNVSCVATGPTPPEPAQYLLSGNWFDLSLNGQGIQFELNVPQRLLFAPWYTYSPDGLNATDPATTQRWYTLQLQGVDPSATSFHDIPVFSTVGGVFDAPDPVTISQVGSADVVFHGCTAATMTYRFTTGENAGRTDAIELSRVGPAPEGCSF